MVRLTVTENEKASSNLLYIQSTLGEIFSSSGARINLEPCKNRAILNIDCPESYAEIIRAEVFDKIAEIVSVKYKYDFFSERVKTVGLNPTEKELLLTGLIAADFKEDKRYAFSKLPVDFEVAIDGAFNFRMQPMKSKWKEIVEYVPLTFLPSQLKDFVTFLLENKKKRVYVDNGKVYDSHYRRLKRCQLLGKSEVKIVREVLLSNCGEVELCGEIPSADEYFIKEFFGDRVYFSKNYTN
ncbi:MAG: hypothetical protein IJZ73_04105 [Clostridia bacterium]|nr:hypothetical protein [Clostridia bacterium]